MRNQMLMRYNEALSRIPAPGGGCHPALLGVATLGILAGITPAQSVEDIFKSIPVGKRRVPLREVEQAVDRALQDSRQSDKVFSRTQPPTINPDNFFTAARRYSESNSAFEEHDAELWERSTIRMDWPPEEDAAQLIHYLYTLDDLLFIGERHDPGVLGRTIRPAYEWVKYFRKGGQIPPHIICNPLCGKLGTTKDGKPTMRGDDCIKAFRFAVVEFDDRPKAEQAAFFQFARLPLCAVIDSGGKSLHGWVRVNASDDAEWTAKVENGLFERLLRPLGVDTACKNESRMSRCPGHFRDNKNLQKLLFLDPEAKGLAT